MKVLTFTFDDGLIESAHAVDRILGEDKATFFLTTGWVLPNTVPIEDALNVGRDHGTIEEWQALSRAGHDIGSHSVSHRVPEYLPEHAEAVRREYDESLQFIKRIHDGPYSVATPYHREAPVTPRLDTLYQAVRLGPGPLNALDAIDFSAVHTLDQDSPLELVPDNVWAVFALHGIDEGHRPVTAHHFAELVARARSLGFVIRTMKQMVIEFRCKRPSSFNGWVERLEWTGQASADQQRMMTYLKGLELRGRKLLHVGTGDSGLGTLCAQTAELVDTTSISPLEIDKANALGLPNYRGFLCNKYLIEELLPLAGRKYDLIIDNNLASFACCRLHFLQMMRAYLGMLAPGGAVLVDELSLFYVDHWLDPHEWALNAQRLGELGALLGFSVRRRSVDQLALEPTGAQIELPAVAPVTAARPARRKALDPAELPIVINSRDQLGSLKQLVDWLVGAGCGNVIILDNASTFPPLLDYLASAPVKVVRLEENLGPHSMWQPGIRARLKIDGPFVFTDPDVVPIAECPRDVVAHLYDVLMSRPSCGTVGLGLKIDDLPEHYQWKQLAVGWEAQFWKKQVGPGLFYGKLDTTFALHGTYSTPPQRAIRTGYPYLARHLPWYADTKNPSEEAVYYAKHAKGGASHWNANAAPGGCIEQFALERPWAAGPDSLERVQAVRHSGLFDEAYYLATQPDVAAAGCDGFNHYLKWGAREGRDPHPLFDTSMYLAENPDVTGNPLVHFYAHGGAEGRSPHPLFDAAFYLEQYSDVAAAKLNPLIHYLQHGAREGRSPHPLFDGAYYLRRHPDVVPFGNPLLHFVLWGAREGRASHPVPRLFDLSSLLRP